MHLNAACRVVQHGTPHRLTRHAASPHTARRVGQRDTPCLSPTLQGLSASLYANAFGMLRERTALKVKRFVEQRLTALHFSSRDRKSLYVSEDVLGHRVERPEGAVVGSCRRSVGLHEAVGLIAFGTQVEADGAGGEVVGRDRSAGKAVASALACLRCHIVLHAFAAHVDSRAGSLGIALNVASRQQVTDAVALGICRWLEYPAGSLADAPLAGDAVVALHVIDHIGRRAAEVTDGVGLILQGPVLRAGFVAAAIGVVGCGVESVVSYLTYLVGRENALEEPGIIYVSPEVILARLVSADAESAGASLKGSCRDGAVALPIYIIGDALPHGVADDGDVLPCAGLEGACRGAVLCAAQEVVVEKDGSAAARRNLGTSVEVDTPRSGIVPLCQDDFVAEVVAALCLVCGIWGLGVLVENPGAEGGLGDAGIKDARGVQVEVLRIAVQLESLSHLSVTVGDAVWTCREDIPGRRGVVQAAVEGVVEDQLSPRIRDVLRDTEADALGPSVPQSLHLAHLLGVFRREVVRLGEVVGEVEELPAATRKRGEPPVALADGLASFVLPVHHALVVPALFLLEQRHDATPLVGKRLDAVAAVERRIGRTRQLQAGGHDVEEAAGLRRDGSLLALSQARRPVDDGGSRRAAVELRCLPVAVGCVDSPCPACVQVVVGELSARNGSIADHRLPVSGAVLAVEVADGVVLARRAIIGCEDDEGVVEDAPSLQLVDDAPYVLVHTVYHGGMHLHVCRLEGLVCLILPLASGGIRGGRRLRGVNESQFLHPLVAALAQGIPAVVEPALVLGDVLRLGMQRPVWFLEGNVHEEGTAVGGHLIHHVDGLVRHEVGVVEVSRNAVREDRLLVVDKGEGVEVVRHAPDGAPVLVEAPVAGIGVEGCEGTVPEVVLMGEPLHLFRLAAYAFGEREVPFAAHGSVVSGIAECLGNGDTVVRHAQSHAGDAYGLCVAACQKLRPRRTAAPGVVELREAHAVLGQRVEVRTLHLAAETLQVGVAHVVNDDEHDVGPRSLLRGGNCRQQGRQCRQGALIVASHTAMLYNNVLVDDFPASHDVDASLHLLNALTL